MSDSVLSALVVVALLLSVAALAVAVLAWRKASRRGRSKVPGPRTTQVQRPARTSSGGGETASADVLAELDSLRADVGSALRHMAVVRYDAFGDMGGHLSWSMALLDDAGDGVVVTSIHGRSDARTYAKNVTGGKAAQQLAPEEEEAITYALS